MLVKSAHNIIVHMARPSFAELQFYLVFTLIITEIVAIATISKEAARNVTSSLGETGSITCPLEGTMGGGQELRILRLVNNSWILLSSNTVSHDTRKYVVTGDYVLTIRDIGFDDQGLYRCALRTSHVDIHLSVIDFSSASLSIFWSSATDGGLHPGALVTLTCHVTYSRPPAKIRWTRDGHDVTSRAYVIKSNGDAQGYGDTTSVLTFQLTQSDASAIYRCAADVGSNRNALYDQILIQSDEFSREITSTAVSTKKEENLKEIEYITEPPTRKNSHSTRENSHLKNGTNKTSPEAVLSTSMAGGLSSPRFELLCLPLFFATSLCAG